MIQGGYILKARQIKNSAISKAAPCTREVWDYLILNAYFMDTKIHQRGQLTRSYQQIINDMAWNIGARPETYTTDQVKRAFKFLRKHKMILTKKTPDGVIITICNYNYFQDKANYESPSPKPEAPNKISSLEPQKTNESPKSGHESPRNEPTESPSPKPEDTCKTNVLELPKITESPNESPRNEPTIDNIQQYKSIESIINKIILPDPEPGEIDFERDRRIFFQSFPGVKTFQTFDDNSERKSPKLVKQFHVKDVLPVDKIIGLEKINSMGAGIFLTINETNGEGRKATDIVKVRAVFADLDGSPLEPVWEYNPSLVVESSPGKYHAYWFCSDVPRGAFGQLQESISYKFNSDPKVKDLPRVMRVPGFEHRKADPFLSRIIHYTGQEFTFLSLVEILPPKPRKQWSGEKYQKSHNPVNNGEFKGQYGANNGGRNNHIITRVGGMIKKGLSWSDIEHEAFKEAQACNPPLSETETRAILNSAQRYI